MNVLLQRAKTDKARILFMFILMNGMLSIYFSIISELFF